MSPDLMRTEHSTHRSKAIAEAEHGYNPLAGTRGNTLQHSDALPAPLFHDPTDNLAQLLRGYPMLTAILIALLNWHVFTQHQFAGFIQNSQRTSQPRIDTDEIRHGSSIARRREYNTIPDDTTIDIASSP